MVTFSQYMQSIFGRKVRKIAVNASLGCPNMDAASGMKGCTYCNNASFSPNYTKGNIRSQIEKGKEFTRNKGEREGYLAYFQSFTGTYGPTEKLVQLYEEALETPGVIGLVIATRPDCIADDLLEYFSHRFGNCAPANHPYLLVEIGVESTNDRTLEMVNRGHTWECAKNAIRRIDGIGIDVGAHLIIGLPGETQEDFVRHVKRISELPVKTLKLHQLQIIRGTAMARQYTAHPEEFHLFTAEEYARTVDKLLKHIRPDIALDRFVSEAPKGMVIAPSWGLKPSEFADLLERVQQERNAK